jgi:hypothetical protein
MTCLPGTVSRLQGSVECVRCPFGTVANDRVWPTDCIRCPVAAWPDELRSVCLDCPSNNYAILDEHG